MRFKRKGKLRKQYDDQLFSKFNQFKLEWQNREKVIENSLDPTDDAKLSLLVSKGLCMFLLKELKDRKAMEA